MLLSSPLQTFYWGWYCNGREQGSSLQSFMRAFITGWLPSLLLNLWLAMVMPRLVYLIVQVGLSPLSACFSCSLLSTLIRRQMQLYRQSTSHSMHLRLRQQKSDSICGCAPVSCCYRWRAVASA